MLPHLADVCGACIPALGLAALAEVRAVPGVVVHRKGGLAWVRWEGGAEDVLRRLLPIPGVVLYDWREGLWYRFGSVLPAFEVPADAAYLPLADVLFPAPVQPLPSLSNAERRAWAATPLTLALDEQPRPATAMLAPVGEVLVWADTVPASRLAQVRAAWNGAMLLVVGSRLPLMASGERLWGSGVLTPLGYRLEPDVPESLVRLALDVLEEELLLVRMNGTERVARAALEPLQRASLRMLAQEAAR